MMKTKKRRLTIKYKKERVILSDVLPYELPIIFTNRYFYRFVTSYGVELKNDEIKWNLKDRKLSDRDKKILPTIIELLMGCSQTSTITDQSINTNKDSWRTPFTYKISHKDDEFRELSIIHPKNQLELVSLYEKYKELIIYYCSLSRFSIRKPNEIAKFIYYRDKLHRISIGSKLDNIEVYMNEYESLKTFFTYKKYTNIYRFYEDYRYQRAEKKYNKLVKFDISKCFDSIYTHSIVWALLGKDATKDHLSLSKNTFGGQFDSFMQSINYGETNGILIGPEFSRIFAELIFQKIDKAVENKLKEEGIYIGKQYECYRYVDDFFLFYNEDDVKEKIMTLFRLTLREYKMGLSNSKTIHYERPIISNISMAKFKIIDLLDSFIKFNIEEAESFEETDEEENEDKGTFHITDKFKMYINSNQTSAKFKSILKETEVGYKDVLNYTLSIISRKVNIIIRKFDKRFQEYSKHEFENNIDQTSQKRKYLLEKQFTRFILNLLDFIFFIYTVHPKVNSTIKLMTILNTIIELYNGRYIFKNKAQKRFQKENKDLIFKKIQDEIRLVLEKTKHIEFFQVETLYLLVLHKELGIGYELPEEILINYFCTKQPKDESSLKCKEYLNTLSILVLLYYIGNSVEYCNIKKALMTHIINTIDRVDSHRRRNNTELTILLFDLLSCPYIDRKFKKEVLSLFNIKEKKTQEDILNFQKKQKYWFTKWKDININKELNAKIGLEVYS